MRYTEEGRYGNSCLFDVVSNLSEKGLFQIPEYQTLYFDNH